MEIYILADVGTVLIVALILLLIVIVGGATVLEPMISFFVGPLKYILLAMTILALLVAAGVIVIDPGFNLRQKIIGGISNAVCSAGTVGITFLFLLCNFVGFLQNMDEGHPIWAVFAILSDLIVFVLCFVGLVIVRAIPYACITDRFPTLFFVIVNILLSLLYFCIVQALIIGYYNGTIKLIFQNQQTVIDYLSYPLGKDLLERINYAIGQLGI